jgi:dolichol-phosphate mannosyltransferase
VILDFIRQREHVRKSRKEGWLMNSTRRISCRLIEALSENELQIDAGDFRLVDRRVVDELQKFEYYQPSLRGTIAALGLDQIGLSYERAERTRGKSKFSLRQLISLALDGILNHSVASLSISTYLGLGISLATFLAVVGYAAGNCFWARPGPRVSPQLSS